MTLFSYNLIMMSPSHTSNRAYGRWDEEEREWLHRHVEGGKSVMGH